MVETQVKPLPAEAGITTAGPEEGYSIVVLSKAELLASLREIREFLAEYGTVLEHASDSGDVNQEALQLVRAHHTLLANGEALHAKLHLVAGLFQFLAKRMRQERFAFRIPTKVGLIPEADSEELAEFSGLFRAISGAADRLVSEVAALCDTEMGRSDERVRRVLLALGSFLKSLIRQDWDDLALFVTHINLITTSAESHEIVSQIARIARDIYNSLNEFSNFLDVDSLAKSTGELPDAVVKLKSVITRLEEAANTNLDTLEQLNNQAAETQNWLRDSMEAVSGCEGELKRLGEGDPELAGPLDAVRAILNDEVAPALTELDGRIQGQTQTYMTMIANQSFQDLTGQTLKKVITFIESMQFKLVQLLPSYKPQPPAAEGQDAEVAPRESGHGKAIQSQEQVDQMLADLGF